MHIEYIHIFGYFIHHIQFQFCILSFFLYESLDLSKSIMYCKYNANSPIVACPHPIIDQKLKSKLEWPKMPVQEHFTHRLYAVK